MAEQLKRVYLASCPFCRYREFFSSEMEIFMAYSVHLSSHEQEALERRGRGAMDDWVDLVSQHLKRLEAAPFN